MSCSAAGVDVWDAEASSSREPRARAGKAAHGTWYAYLHHVHLVVESLQRVVVGAVEDANVAAVLLARESEGHVALHALTLEVEQPLVQPTPCTARQPPPQRPHGAGASASTALTRPSEQTTTRTAKLRVTVPITSVSHATRAWPPAASCWPLVPARQPRSRTQVRFAFPRNQPRRQRTRATYHETRSGAARRTTRTPRTPTRGSCASASPRRGPAARGTHSGTCSAGTLAPRHARMQAPRTRPWLAAALNN